MFCEHKRLKSVNCVIYCADCGKMVEPPAQTAQAVIDAEPVKSAGGRKIGFEAEKKTAPRRRKRGGSE